MSATPRQPFVVLGAELSTCQNSPCAVCQQPFALALHPQPPEIEGSSCNHSFSRRPQSRVPKPATEDSESKHLPPKGLLPIPSIWALRQSEQAGEPEPRSSRLALHARILLTLICRICSKNRIREPLASLSNEHQESPRFFPGMKWRPHSCIQELHNALTSAVQLAKTSLH